MVEFVAFPKIPRLKRNCVITEKIDGTNAAIRIAYEDGPDCIGSVGDMFLYAQSRSRMITPEKDNFGFAAWAAQHIDELVLLGEGIHFGEWWGPGIQRGYGLKEKKFSLFNTSRWHHAESRPLCCDVVPVLYSGIFTTSIVDEVLEGLRISGSMCSPGFMRPEGVVVYQIAAKQYFKRTLEKDEMPKGLENGDE